MTRKAVKSSTRSDSFWRRLALGAAISFGLHLAVAVWARPDFKDVADRAVAFEVAEITPGPLSPVPSKDEKPPEIEPQGPPAPPPQEEKPAPAEPDESKGAVVEKQDTDPDAAADTDRDTDTEKQADSGSPASSTATDSGSDTETAGGGSGICLHDLFPFAPSRPNWMLWVSMASLRGTVFERDVAATLGAYGITRKLERVTGLDPASDVASILVSAEDILNWNTYFIAASHDVAEERLKNTIAASYSGTSFSWRPTAQGWQADSPDGLRYHCVASGRALIVEALEQSAPRPGPKAGDSDPTPAPQTTSDRSPHKPDPDEPAAGVEAQPGGPAEDTQISRDSDFDSREHKDMDSSGEPPLAPAAYPGWPGQITCLVENEAAGPGAAPSNRNQGAASPQGLEVSPKSSLKPDDGGHWPVAYLYTSDPRALGLPPEQAQNLGFRQASLRSFFSEEKVRIWGRVYLSGSQARIEQLAAGWARLAEASRGDPFVKMLGLSGVFDHLAIKTDPGSVSFTVELTPSQTRAGLLFLRMQGEALGRRLSPP